MFEFIEVFVAGLRLSRCPGPAWTPTRDSICRLQVARKMRPSIAGQKSPETFSMRGTGHVRLVGCIATSQRPSSEHQLRSVCVGVTDKKLDEGQEPLTVCVKERTGACSAPLDGE